MIFSLKYTNDLKDGFAGQTTAWSIKIKLGYEGDVGLLEHEKTHVWQFWRTCGFHSLFYFCFKSYRQWSEVEAYREQLCWPPAISHIIQSKQRYAEFLASKYDLSITIEKAIKLLK